MPRSVKFGPEGSVRVIIARAADDTQWSELAGTFVMAGISFIRLLLRRLRILFIVARPVLKTRYV